MKFQTLLPLVALTKAFVVPDEVVFQQLEVTDHHQSTSILDRVQDVKDKVTNYVDDKFDRAAESARDLFDELMSKVEDDAAVVHDQIEDQYFAATEWVSSVLEAQAEENHPDHPHPPHHGPPHHGDDDHHHGPPHHGPGRRRPHHPPHHDTRNMTIYQLISESKYTTKIAALINDDKKLVEVLNSTKANFTMFVPTDRAFSKIPEDAPKPSKEQIRKVLAYHLVPGFYPAGRVLYSKSFPTAYNESALGGHPQRLSAQVGLRGVTINFYSRIVALNIFASNGVIHGVDSLLIPPPPAPKIIESLPAEFSTLLYAMEKTGIKNESHVGATYFAPTNFAFRKLGPRINGFLFSDRGLKYLKALLQYHVAYDFTLYSTAYYNGTESGSEDSEQSIAAYPFHHVDLPTRLEGRSLAIDIARYGLIVEVKINAFARVSIADGIAKDGVIHVPDNVLIPPRQLPGSQVQSFWTGEELSVEELKERLAPYVETDEESHVHYEF